VRWAASVRWTPATAGAPQRSSLSGQWHRNDGQRSQTKVSAYAMRLPLASCTRNFTYTLERPDATGDQFSQQDERSVYGLQASHAFGHSLGGLPVRTK
jgi:hypothetical protein